jgi:hypothetical protein
VSYRLFEAFRSLFQGQRYLHRRSAQGDWVSYHLYEDLYAVRRSLTLVRRIEARERVLCVTNRRQGVEARRGDGSFGELIPGVTARTARGFVVARGKVATIEIGVEAKILAKAMIKQIDRVINDLVNQVAQFRQGLGNPICIGVVGINHAEECTSYEGKVKCPKCGQVFLRTQRTNGKNHPHPFQEAPEAEARLAARAKPAFGEFLILRYKATNVEPYRFEWVDYEQTALEYGAILVRISREYDRRFGAATEAGPSEA